MEMVKKQMENREWAAEAAHFQLVILCLKFTPNRLGMGGGASLLRHLWGDVGLS